VDGYSFSGWNTKVDGTGVSYVVGSVLTVDEEDVVLYAQWTEQKYVVTVIDSFAGVSSGAGNYVGGSVVTIRAGSRVDYVFVGWTVDFGDVTLNDYLSVTTLFVMPYESVSVTANWQYIGGTEPLEVYVWYNGNGATDGSVPVDTNNPYDRESLVVVLDKNSLVKEGYTFLGWALTSNADTPTYLPGSTFTILSDTTLYAVWEQAIEETYTVTYLPGNHGAFDEQVTKGLSYGDPTPKAPTVTGEDGWLFIGWSPEPSTIVTEDVVYIAQWEQEILSEVFTVRFVDWNGALLKEERVPYGGSATAPSAPSRLGYTFIGWDRAFNNVVSDLTVTALYRQNDSGSSTTPSKPAPKPTPTLPPPVETTPPPPTETPPGTDEPLAMWALANLVLSIVGVIIAVILVICALLKKKRETEQKKETKDQYVEDYTEEQKKRSTLWVFVTIAMGIASVVVFLLTEDMNLKMGIFDKWTIINAILFVIEIIALVLYTKTQKTTNHKQQANKDTQNPTNSIPIDINTSKN
jgi:uncharacterized repeat protein (TIGR02543 family)